MTISTLSTIRLYAVAAALGVLVVMLVAPLVIDGCRRIAKRGVIFTAIAAAFLYCAATKPTSHFTFESGLRDNGSYTTNSTVHVSWTLASIIPSDAPVYIECRQHGQSGPYTSLAETTVGEYQWTTNNFANATNFDFNIWYYYIPPSPVLTNGTWQYRTNKTRDNRFALPIGAKIEERN